LTSDFRPEVEMSHVCACTLKNMQYTLIYGRSAEIPVSYGKSGSRNTMVTRLRWHDDTMADTTFHRTYFWFEESKLKQSSRGQSNHVSCNLSVMSFILLKFVQVESILRLASRRAQFL